MSNLPMKIDPPLMITIVNQGRNSWGVQHDAHGCGGLTWDEMLGQIAALTAPDGVERRPAFERPVTLTIVSQGDERWGLLLDGQPVIRGASFEVLLGHIVRRTFPETREPGAPLFRPRPQGDGASEARS